MTAPAHRSRNPGPELGLTIAFALAFAVWTWLVLRGSLHDLDARLRPPALAPRSARGQLAESLSLLTHPVLVLIIVVGSVVFSLRQRMRRLALALSVGALGAAGQLVLSLVLDVPRPPTAFADSISHFGGAYPASHVTAVVLGTWVLVTLVRARRRGPTSVVGLNQIGRASCRERV